MPLALAAALKEARSVLLTTTDLDGDAVGAIVAVALIVEQVWPEKVVRIIAHESMPSRYASLVPDRMTFRLAAETEIEVVDLALVLDGDTERLRDAAPHYRVAVKTGIIDHHHGCISRDFDVSLYDPAAASTTELVFQLAKLLGVEMDQELAGAIYAGMVFDTSIFRYRLTRPATLRAAAVLLETGIDHARIVENVLLQQSAAKVRLRGRMIEKMQLEFDGRLAWAVLTQDEVAGVESGGLVDDLVFVEGVEVGALFVENVRGEFKASLRSRGGVDVSKLAQAFSPMGGGHKRAAGATLKGEHEAVIPSAIELTRKALAGSV